MIKSYKFLLRFLICLLPLAVAVYSIWYWHSGYGQLLNWYKNLNPYFYQANNFSQLFFTPFVKSRANGYCLIALLASVLVAILLWKSPAPAFPRLKISKSSVLVYSGILISGIILSLIANKHSKYAADEVFSALNFASIPLFQRISYYALPNNHVLFNFLNGLIFFSHDNLVHSGRIISLFCYLVVLCISWYFLKKWIANIWLRLISLSVLAFQFPAWGFSGQSRGYELLLMLSILSLIAFWLYWSDKKLIFLYLHSISNIAGMLTLPTYLYWWAGLLLSGLIFMIFIKKPDRAFIRFSFLSVLMTVILYLPLLSFSGLSAFAFNRYFQPEATSRFYLITHLNNGHYLNGLFNEWYCSGNAPVVIGTICALIPLILLKSAPEELKYRNLGILYLSMLIAFFTLIIAMNKLPFYRNLIAHAYLALMLFLITAGTLYRSEKLKIAFGIVLIIFMAFSAHINYGRMPENLYYYEVNSTFNKLYHCKTEFKAGSSVFLSDESYYWWYILKSKYPNQDLTIQLNKPTFNGQDYCIMPVGLKAVDDTSLYHKVESCDEYDIYKKK